MGAGATTAPHLLRAPPAVWLMHVDERAADTPTVRGAYPSLAVPSLRQFAAGALGISLSACVPPVAPCTGDDCGSGLVCELGACVAAGAAVERRDGAGSSPGAPVQPEQPPPGIEDHAVRQVLEIPASDEVQADLHDLPLLVQLTSEPLRIEAFGGDVRHADGADIGFFDVDGAPLPSEIERYDGELGALTAWVRVPRVGQGTATTITMAWGADGADARSPLWDDDYHGVWHLADAPATDGVIADATSHGADGLPANLSDADALLAVAGRGLRFSHAAAHVELELGGPGGWSRDTTIEAWVRIDPGATGAQWIASSLGVDLGVDNSESDRGPTAVFRAGYGHVDCDLTQFLSGTFNLSTSDWHHVAGVIEDLGEDGSRASLFIDGLCCGSATAEVPPLDPLVIVGNLLPFDDLDGELDELRVARRALSPEELYAQVTNARSPSTFFVAHEPVRRD